jgi:hypothetical protein
VDLALEARQPRAVVVVEPGRRCSWHCVVEDALGGLQGGQALGRLLRPGLGHRFQRYCPGTDDGVVGHEPLGLVEELQGRCEIAAAAAQEALAAQHDGLQRPILGLFGGLQGVPVVGLGLRGPTKVEVRHAASEHRDLTRSGRQAPPQRRVGSPPPEPSGGLGVLGNVVDEVMSSNGVVHPPIGRRDALQVVNGGFADAQRALWPATGKARRGDNQATSGAQLAEAGRFPQPQLLGGALVEEAEQPRVGRPWSVPARLPVVDHGDVHAQRPLSQPVRKVTQFADDIREGPGPPQSLGSEPFVGLPLRGHWRSHRPFPAFREACPIGRIVRPR